MAIALDPDLVLLADSVGQLCARHAPMPVVRAAFGADSGPLWPALVEQGLHALHLPGQGGGLLELAVVAEQLGRHLAPGPWLTTVTASAVLALADPSDESFLNGATGAVVWDAAVEGDRLVRDSGPTLGLPGPDRVLVESGGRFWSLEGGGSRPVDSLDLTRTVGVLEAGARLEPLPEVDPDLVRLWRCALLAADAAGVAGWALTTAVEHLKTREQFGQPLGAFQALQHRAAGMLVRQESAVASAWDAARASYQSPDQHGLAAAAAVVTALPAAVDNAFDLVTLLGALGITWEHDAHLYERRALSLLASAGDTASWARRLGSLALQGSRASGVDDPSVLPELRAEVGAVLDRVAALPEDPRHTGAFGTWTGGDRQDVLADAGLIAPHLPPPLGRGAGPQEQAVIADEFSKRGQQQPTMIVGDWALATLVANGSPEQVARFAEPSLRGSLIWCQLFSEPGAGSDLASVRTRAERVDGGWKLTGQKVWNSRACEADWGVCLARTDSEAAKHKGLTFFLVDMSSPGVEARPIQQTTRVAELAEVFLDEVFVPDDCVVGEVNGGWRVAVGTLGHERTNMGTRMPYGAASTVARLLDEGTAQRDDVLRVVGECAARESTVAALNLRSVLGRMAGRDMAAEASVNKVLSASAQRDGARSLVSLLGPLGVVDGGLATEFLGMPAMLFGGGTLEVQLNVIAMRVLGLPRS